ncbi:MAG: glycosyltransferase [Patescibacteria group bacterium]
MVQVSRLECKQKAQDILLNALHFVVYFHEIKNIYLDFIGDGPSCDYLKALTKELELDSYCSFLGQKSREFINANLKDYNLLVQPSTFEGFGLTVVEGMAARIPVLVSNIDGPIEIIQHGKLGYLFEVGNPRDCGKQIINIMSEYEKQGLKEKVDLAYRYALEHFDVKQTAVDYITQYQKLM